MQAPFYTIGYSPSWSNLGRNEQRGKGSFSTTIEIEQMQDMCNDMIRRRDRQYTRPRSDVPMLSRGNSVNSRCLHQSWSKLSLGYQYSWLGEFDNRRPVDDIE